MEETMQQGERTTKPQTAMLTGSWPRAAVATIERALQLNGQPLELVNEEVKEGPGIHRSDCRVVYRQDGRAMCGGDIPVEGMVVDGIEFQLQLVYPGDNKPVEHMTLQTDMALRYEDDDLETCDIRPIATPAALEEDGFALRKFLARACTHITPATRGVKASALARASRSRTRRETENEPRPFAIEEIAAWGTPLSQDHSERSEIYDATAGPEGITIAEPGWGIWGYLRRLEPGEREQYRLPAGVAATLSWTDGSEDGAESDVQLLERSDAKRVETDSTGAIIDRILKHYRLTGGGDDGHPAYALYTLDERRGRAAAKAMKELTGSAD